MKKIIIALCVAVVLFAVGYNAYQSQKQATTGKQKVYAVLPLTGWAAHIGQQQKKSLELWQKFHPNAPFDIVVIDSQINATATVSALQQKLVNETNPVVISSASLISYNIFPLVKEKKGFSFMVCTFEKNDFADTHFLRIGDRSVDSIMHVAKYLKNYNSTTVFYTNEEFGKNNAKALKQMLDTQNVEYIPLEPTQKDIHIEALKVLSNAPEAVAILGFPSLGIMNMIRELRLKDYKGQIVMGTALADPNIVEQLGNYVEGIVFPDKKATVNSQENLLALNEMEKAINGRPYYVPIEIWDALDLIDWTIKNNKPFTQETYANLKNWKGLAGDIEFLNDGNVIYQFYLATFKDGKIVPVESEEK